MSFSIASNARRHSRNCPGTYNPGIWMRRDCLLISLRACCTIVRALDRSHVAQNRPPVAVLRADESSHRPQALQDSPLAADYGFRKRGRSLSTTSSSSASKPWGDVQDRRKSSIVSREPMAPFEYDGAGGISCPSPQPPGRGR